MIFIQKLEIASNAEFNDDDPFSNISTYVAAQGQFTRPIWGSVFTVEIAMKNRMCQLTLSSNLCPVNTIDLKE